MASQKANIMISTGKKIKTVRTQKKITLEQVANDTGYKKEYIQKIEAGTVIPPVGAILQISRALQIDSGLLLKDQEEKVEKRAKAYTKRTDNYAYTTLTPGAENKHLKAFRVNIQAMKEHKKVAYQHEGEEFVYVLSGRIEIEIGENLNTLKKGESLHFNSAIKHKLRNIGKTDAELLVVIYSP
ncbi:MAG: XRE family transcriptional regulator [Pseudomonadota bacterium]